MSKYGTNVPALGWNNLRDCAFHNLFVSKIMVMVDLVVFLVLVLIMMVVVMVMVMIVPVVFLMVVQVVFPHCHQCVCGRYQSAKTPTDHVIAY